MKRLKPLALCLALLLAAPLIYAPLTPKAEALGDVVNDPDLIALTKTSWVKQVVDMAMQIEQYQTQIKHMETMLSRLNQSAVEQFIGKLAIAEITKIYNTYRDEQRIRDYKLNYPDFIDAAAKNKIEDTGYKIEEKDPLSGKVRINVGEYQRYRNNLLKNTKQRLQDAMLMQEAEAEARKADLEELDRWRTLSVSAVGAVEAMQINSQIVALQTKIQLRQQALEAMANKAQAAATLNQMQADELASVTMNRQVLVDAKEWKDRGVPGGKPMALTGVLAWLFGKTSPIEYRVEAHL